MTPSRCQLPTQLTIGRSAKFPVFVANLTLVNVEGRQVWQAGERLAG